MTNVSTCLWFDGTAHEAATRYVEIVGGSIDRVTHYPDLDVEGYPPVPAGSVATVEFHLADTPYLALNGGPEFPPTMFASIVVETADQAECDRIWDALLDDGGTEVQCGWLTDGFGVSWQIIPRRCNELMTDPATMEAAFAAMLTMVKLDENEMADAVAAALKRS